MATDEQIRDGIADGRRCPSCQAYWSWCNCTQEMIRRARDRRIERGEVVDGIARFQAPK